MKLSWISAGFVMVGLIASSACSSSGNGGAGGAAGGAGPTGGAGGGMGGAAPTCASMITADLSGWDASMAAMVPDAQALWDCVCGTGTPCSLVCNDSAHPSFCAGTAPVANGQCFKCIETTTGASGCADQYAACMAN
jgi:hypothetical protein